MATSNYLGNLDDEDWEKYSDLEEEQDSIVQTIKALEDPKFEDSKLDKSVTNTGQKEIDKKINSYK